MSMCAATKDLSKKQILKTFITNESYGTVLEEVLALGRARQSSYVCLANSHMLVEASRDPSFNEVVNSATIATPDGKPLSVAMNMLYDTRQEQIAGMDLMQGVLTEAEKSQLTVFF